MAGDREVSAHSLVRSSVGLSRVRDSIEVREAKAPGPIIPGSVWLDCELSIRRRTGRTVELVVATDRAGGHRLGEIRSIARVQVSLLKVEPGQI